MLFLKSTLLNARHPFNPSPSTLRFYGLPFSLSSSYFFLPFPYVHLLSFSTYEWNQMISVFLWLISLSIIASSSIHIVEKAKISLFFVRTSIIFFITATLLYSYQQYSEVPFFPHILANNDDSFSLYIRLILLWVKYLLTFLRI